MNHIQNFQQEQNPPQLQMNPPQYNRFLIRYYLKNSFVTLFSFFIMSVMFFVTTIMTYSSNKQYKSQYGITNFNPIVLIQLGANYSFQAKNGQIYRLVAPIFLHAGIQHFFINSLSIFGFLMLVQPQFKIYFFIIAFYIGGIQGNLASLYSNYLRSNSNFVAVGVSTSICAIIGLYLGNLYIQSLKNRDTDQAKRRIKMMVGYIFILSLLPGVDFYGHFGSLICGALIGLSFQTQKDFKISANIYQIKRIRILSLIILILYSLFLLSIFFI